MLQRYLRKIAIFLFNFFYLQLFLTVLSWPIMLWWGLPLSKAACLGNLLFNPFLMLFLLISSLVFMCALLGMPYSWLSYLLDSLTQLWLHLTSYASPSWLLGAPKPSLGVGIFIMIGALFIMYTRLLKNGIQKCAALLIFFITMVTCLNWWYVPTNAYYQLACGRTQIPLIIHEKKTFLIIPTHFNTKANLKAWVEYTFLPFLTQKTGKVMLDGVLFLSHSSHNNDLINIIGTYQVTKTIFLPSPEDTFFIKEVFKNMQNQPEVEFYDIQSPPDTIKPLFQHLQTLEQKYDKNKKEKNKNKEKHDKKTNSTCCSS